MIALVDYDMGNLRSVQKGLERVGHAAVVTSDPEVVRHADKIVLPGVGAFSDAIASLRERGLVDPLCDAIAAGTPLLGICLGMQLLFERSHEDGVHEGLGVLPGEVVRFAGLPHECKVPHMGWNQLSIKRPSPVLEGIHDGDYFYFVHSYYVRPGDAGLVAAETDYHVPFCSCVHRDNVFAAQFHPEKSQACGLRLLRNFAEL
ncbi:imidazole glycerol phosphate synthase subunit HisH [Pirellulimonas nuda]|uniref:imidazole glycerol phosphate synthase subunit HisH n=1 Tax=Pirellulimonas nuda TaxID=2528009 RepID=UPI0011A1FF5D|nr:imidazole glycerol phosphate synthase subunit HisH [Pirellulimonas nuda]